MLDAIGWIVGTLLLVAIVLAAVALVFAAIILPFIKIYNSRKWP